MIGMFFESLIALMSPITLAMMLGGTVLGLFFGALPGLNATMAVAIMLPITFALQPEAGLAVLMSAYIGGISGGLVSAVLLRVPGTPSSVATTFDAYPLAQKGQAIKALGTGMLASFLGGMFSLAVLVATAPIVASVAIKFGPFEFTALAVLALTLVGVLSVGNMVKGLLSALLGVAIGLVGFAPIDGTQRFTFGELDLAAGVALVPFMIGLFAVSQLIRETLYGVRKVNLDLKVSGIAVKMSELLANWFNILRSSFIGVGIGILPGIGGAASNLVAYAVAKQSSKKPETFGKGAVDGIWASESANNASVGGALLPLLTLGIPGDGVTAILIAGFEIHGLQPGPLMFKLTPGIVASVYAAFFITALMVLAIQLGTIRTFPRLLLIPRQYLLPFLMVLVVIGAYAADNRSFDIWLMFAMGVLGYLLERYGFPLAPLVLGFVMGGILETNLRRALMFSEGDLTPFITKPVPAVFLALSVASVIYGIRKSRGARTRKERDLT